MPRKDLRGKGMQDSESPFTINTLVALYTGAVLVCGAVSFGRWVEVAARGVK